MATENEMTTKQVADRMSELFKENNWNKVQEELYSDDCESIEPPNAPGLQSVKGRAALIQKGKEFEEAIEEMHGGWVSELLIGGNYITCTMGLDVTMKGMGRMKMDEVCVYEVKNGKVVKEQFFY